MTTISSHASTQLQCGNASSGNDTPRANLSQPNTSSVLIQASGDNDDSRAVVAADTVNCEIGSPPWTEIARRRVYVINHQCNKNARSTRSVFLVTEQLMLILVFSQLFPIYERPCHSANSWMRDSEKDQVVAFHVCIPAERSSHRQNNMA